MCDKMGNASSGQWSVTYNNIREKHDAAYSAIEEAITLEEQEKPNEAIDKYKRGIELIDLALAIQVSCPDMPDVTWEKACVMVQKIKKTRAEVLMRITSIQSSPAYMRWVEEQPPSYEEAVSSSDSDAPRTYSELATALSELSLDTNKMKQEVVYEHDDVRIYFINKSGQVRAIQDRQTLKIFRVDGEEANAPRAVLEVGEWIYPLVPGVSPCYRTDYGAFILPDVDEPGSSVGLILPKDADSEVFDLLENILHGIVTKEIEEQICLARERREIPNASARIYDTLVNGGWLLSKGMVRGAQKTGQFLNYGTPKLLNHIKGAEHATEVNPKLSKGIEIAESATSKAVVLTGFVADKVGTATMKLGQFLAPHIQKQGTRLLASGFNMSEQDASDKMKGVLTVAAGAVEGFATVYRGLETSAGILGTSLKDNTVKVVQHKYGVQAGDVADDALGTVGNVYHISQNSKLITPRGLAKRTGKDMGKALVRGYAHQQHHSPNIPSTSGLSNTSPQIHHKNGEPEKNQRKLSSSSDLSSMDEEKNFNNA